MAFTITQEFPLSDHEAWWLLKEKLVAAGASVKSSSDATTYGAGDNLSAGGPYPQSGAGSFANTNAWMVIQFPAVGGVTREVCFQKTASVGRIVFYYSSDGTGFSGGTATVRPTATDEQFLQNNGDNVHEVANPQETEVTFWVGDATEGYSWMMQVRQQGFKWILSLSFMDVVTSPVTGDTDPCVMCCHTDNSNSPFSSSGGVFSATAVNNATSTNIAGWLDKGGLDEWVAWPLCYPGMTAGTGGAVQIWHRGVNAWQGPNDAGNYDMMPAVYSRGEQTFTSNSKGFKGISRLFRIIPSLYEHARVSADGLLVANEGIVRPWSAALPKVWY